MALFYHHYFSGSKAPACLVTQSMADRYSYIASIGIFYLLAEGLRWLYFNKANNGF